MRDNVVKDHNEKWPEKPSWFSKNVLSTLHQVSSEPARVYYFIDLESSRISYQQDHVMRPLRVQLAYSLVKSLGLHHRITHVCRPEPATAAEMRVFHREAYLECLRQAPRLCGHPLDPTSLAFQKEFDVPVGSKSSDCPLFPKVWELACSQAGGSLACADVLNSGVADVAIHFGGGMHHAAAAHASGFCFVNDIVLCIHRLLKSFSRILYVDLDVHHGDGVEAAFVGNPRVLTLSLHQFGNSFFPGTGDYVVDSFSFREGQPFTYEEVLNNPHLCDGTSFGSSFSVNVPLPPRTGDSAYFLSFRTAYDAIFSLFDPEAVVVQCGADTICGDPIGRLCISTRTHVACVRHILKSGSIRNELYASNVGNEKCHTPLTFINGTQCSSRKKVPTVLLGGGGYHVLHTAQCWALHTAAALGVSDSELPLYIPREDPYYMDYREQCHATASTRGCLTRGTNRPTLHVFLDPDVDHPLPIEISLIYYRQFCRTLPSQLRTIRVVRQGFDRILSISSGIECAFLRKKLLKFRKKERKSKRLHPTKITHLSSTHIVLRDEEVGGKPE